MKTDLFDFDLPGELIAQHPVQPRDAARLLSVDDGLSDRSIRELPELLRPGDILVFNDTRVIPARLFGRRGSVRIEVTLLSEAATGRWCALAPAAGAPWPSRPSGSSPATPSPSRRTSAPRWWRRTAAG
jgi:S-adenosylmethionine:tRNA ribosyltransferase-isomerase